MSVFMGANNKETNQHLSLVNIIELFFKYFFDNFSSGDHENACQGVLQVCKAQELKKMKEFSTFSAISTTGFSPRWARYQLLV